MKWAPIHSTARKDIIISITQYYTNCMQEIKKTCLKNMSWIFVFPQQRKLMGSSAQISSGVRVPVCAGVGSGGKFRKVAEGFGGSGGFRRGLLFATLTGAAMFFF